MCQVSDKIKLCSCKTKDVEQLKHYWVLNRPKNKDEVMLGDIIPPADIGEQLEKLNIHTLRTQLNNENCYDVVLLHEENDILELHFTCTLQPKTEPMFHEYGNYLVYAFVFKKGKWRKTSYDPFGNSLSFVQAGKIKQRFVKL